VAPDWAYLKAKGPFLVAGMLAPAAGLEAGPIRTAKWKWIWLGLFLATGLVIEASNLRLIDYRRLQAGFLHPTWEIWTEKYYTYWLLLLVWAVVAFFSWRRKVDRLVILGLLGLTAMLIWCSGRSARSLGILTSGVAVYSLLNTIALSPRQLKIGLALLVLWWGAAPWLFKAFDLSQVDPRVGERTQIYRTTHDLILQRPWTGHGFGQAALLTHPLLPRRFQQHLPGGHPHNLALLFWLEYGLAGALFLCAVTWYLLRRVIDSSSGRGTWPALAALIVSFVAMVSFSWDIWEYSIILFYAAFAALVVLILNLDDERAADGQKPDQAGRR
jgi:O-antigen ligase